MRLQNGWGFGLGGGGRGGTEEMIQGEEWFTSCVMSLFLAGVQLYTVI